MVEKPTSTTPGQQRFGRDAPESGLVMLTSCSSGFDPKQKPSVLSSLLNHLFCGSD